jgi:hypothetical protein
LRSDCPAARHPQRQLGFSFNFLRRQADFEKFLGALAKLRGLTISFVMSDYSSVCAHEENSTAIGRIFVKFDI